MSEAPLRVAALGMGWWSDVLADAIKRSEQVRDRSLLHALRGQAAGIRRQIRLPRRRQLRGDPQRSLDRRHHQHHAQQRASGDHAQAAEAGKHVFLDKPIANTVREGQEIAEVCKKAGVVLALGYQRRRESHFRWIKSEIDAGRFGKLVQAECNISRDRLGQFDLSSWRYTAAGMPGGVMLQIGIHYVDVLEFLMGPVKSVSARLAQLVLPGDNPDVANMILQHENNALSNLTASYASASEFYMMNIYGKEASAYYDLFSGLRHLKRGEKTARAIATEKNDTIREELEEFARCARNGSQPETDGFWAARNLAVIKAGAKSAREGRVVEVAEILASGE